MAEWCVAEVVAQRGRLHKVLIQVERPGNRPADLGDLERVRQAGRVVVAFRRNKDLALVFQPPERVCVQDPVAVALKLRSKG